MTIIVSYMHCTLSLVLNYRKKEIQTSIYLTSTSTAGKSYPEKRLDPIFWSLGLK